MSINQINTNTSHRVDSRVAEIKKTQDMFFKLLITQLKCQDLDNTVDMTQMTQQLFQMNELQTILDIKYKLDDVNQNLQSHNLGSMIGKYIVSKTDQISISNDNAVMPLSYIIDGNSNSNVRIDVLDNKNNIISQYDLSDIRPNEMQNFELNFRNQDGSLSIPEGIYTVQVLAYDQQNKAIRQSQVYNVNKIQQAMNNGDFILSNNQKILLRDIIAIQAEPLSLIEDLSSKHKMDIGGLI